MKYYLNLPSILAVTITSAFYVLFTTDVLANSAITNQTTTLNSVQVTGSHIKRAQLSGVGPVTVVDAEAIQRSGAISIETLLQTLPAAAGAAGSQTNAYWTGNGYGTTQVNLRGLGINRTLVLLNGRRIVNGGTGANSSVDLNIIPMALIERVEILKDGASAIYGADAVAGVVNIITKKEMDGINLAVRYGQTTKGDGDSTAIDIAWGTRSDQGSLMAAINYSESGSVNMASRTPCGLSVVGDTLECLGSASTIGGRARFTSGPNKGKQINFNQDPNGDRYLYEPYSAAQHNNFDSYRFLNAVNPIKRISLTALGNRYFNDSTNLFTELMYTHRESNQLATPGTLGNYREMNIAANHPTNPTGEDLLLVRRNLAEAGPREFFQETDTFRVVVGINGKIGDRWDWSTALNWGRNTGTDGSTNVANLDRIDNTLDNTKCSYSPGAAIPCGNYLGYGNLSPEVLKYILYTQRDNGGNDQKSATANISGLLFELPAGDMGFAAGVEIRKEQGWRNPDPLIIMGAANSNQMDPIDGKYTAKEVFAELAIPLLKDIPMFNELTLNTAFRYSNYDLFGSDTNYKLGLDWQIIPSLKVRANYASAFRIPNVPELFGGVAEGNLTTRDPCNRWDTDPNVNATVRQNCQNSGVPVGYEQFGTTILTTTGGNQNLEPEDANTLTLGAVWMPPSLPGLTLTLDYYQIKIENAIQTIAGSTKLSTCFNSPNMSHLFCDSSSFIRNKSTGEITYLSAQPLNASTEKVSGMDLGGVYEWDTDSMKFALSLDVSYLKKYDVQPFEGADIIQYAGKITGGRGSFAKWRGFTSFRISKNQWSGNYSIQYIGAANDIDAEPGTIGSRAPAVMYHNMQAAFAFSPVFNITLGVDNLLNKKPPYIQSYTDANTDTMTYDLLGRRLYTRLSYRW